MSPNAITTLILTLLILSSPFHVYALSTDSQQPIEIEADGVKIDERTGTSTYTGDVRLKQGSIRLTAEKIFVYTNKDRNLRKIIATGNLTTFKQLPDNTSEFVEGKARRIEYAADDGSLLLLNDAVLKQEKNVLKSNRIEYDSHNAAVKAGFGTKNKPDGVNNTKKERIKLIIQPPKKKTNK